jgi:Asp-tRNA(Asn)/Glu-tRNA(Gln) amidotransferase A subunit family amidase
MVPLALGTQTGGSVIRPAAFCGVVGLKPSFGSINRAGVKPGSDSLDTVGLFARTVEDAAVALHLLSARALPDFTAKGVPPRIGFARTSRWKDAEGANQASLEAAAAQLAAAGAKVIDVNLPATVDALFEAQPRIMNFETSRALAWEQEEALDLISPTLRRRIDDGWAVSRGDYDAALRIARDARRQFADLMGGLDLLLTPAARGEAPHGLASTGESLFNGIWTLLGVPCITLPHCLGPQGLPLGVQLVGAFDDDTALLSRAQWVADALA